MLQSLRFPGALARSSVSSLAARRLGLPLLCGVTVGACALPPRNPPPATNVSTLSVGFRDSDAQDAVDLRHQPDVAETAVPARLTEVWGVLPSVFEQLEIDVARVDAGAGVMGNPGYRARRVEGERMSRWLDCGRGLIRANADEYDVTLSVIVQLLPAADGLTTVRTTVDAYARDRSLNAGSVHCISWGHLERRVGELVQQRLGA
jgi:hypothetical protein